MKGKLKMDGLDLRALGIFRIGLGLNIVYNVLKYRLFYVEDFYTEKFFVPRAFLDMNYGDSWNMIEVLGAPWAITLFFVVFLFSGIGLTIGFRPRIMAIVALLCMWSTISYNQLLHAEKEKQVYRRHL